MARKAPPKQRAPRKRRTAEEARTAILDAAESALVASGPAGIRLQEVAAVVGVSHPAILHHFGSREGLIEALVSRALDSLHAGLLAAVQEAPKETDQIAAMLDSVYDTLKGGNARAFLWLALSGYAPTMEQFHVQSVALAVHEVRTGLWKAKGKAVPPVEDTYFTVMLPALALLAMAVTTTQTPGGRPGTGKARRAPAEEEEEQVARRFRAWLARIIHEHLEKGWA